MTFSDRVTLQLWLGPGRVVKGAGASLTVPLPFEPLAGPLLPDAATILKICV